MKERETYLEVQKEKYEKKKRREKKKEKDWKRKT